MTDILNELFGGGTPKPPDTPRRAPSVDVGQGRDPFLDDNYGMTAITDMADQMRNALPGGRDTLLNTLCLKAGGLIRDQHLSRDTAEQYLRAAAMEVADESFDEWQIDEKLERVIEEGIDSDYERASRDRPEQETAPGESAPPKMTLHEQMVAKELAVLRAREEARALYEQEKAVSLFRVPPSTRTLAEELTLPDEPVEYAIAELLPVGGNALLTAQYKSGKTTVLGEAARAFADGTPFLGRFEMNPAPGRIAIFNYELSPAQYRRWLRELNIRNTDRVAVLHLRGFRLDLRTQFGQDWCVRWLEEREVSMWAPDPFARAATGVEENSNSEAGEWLDMVDIIKERAGVRDLILPNHTGREKQEQGEERGRGATRLDDWADVRWILTKDKDGNRFFRATGRDVEVGEERLTYDESDRSLRFGGGDKRRVAEDALDRLVVEWVAGHPGSNQTEVERGVEGKAVEIRASLKRCVRLHRLRVEDGPRHALLYTANL